MVRITGRPIEVQPDEVVIGNRVYSRAIEPLQTSAKVNLPEYALNTWDDGNFALSMYRELGGLNFDAMNKEAVSRGLVLARTGDVTPFFRDVNLALRGEGVVYDATGNLIEGERLTQLGSFMNNAWVYLNDAFEEGKGFKELDVVHITGSDGQTPITERQPLEAYAVDCWADVQDKMNTQGYFTQKAPVQKFEQGNTIYQYAPVAGRVAGLLADSGRANLGANWYRHVASARLGGIFRAEGTPQEIEGKK